MRATWVFSDGLRILNRVYRTERALHEDDLTSHGFEWIDCNDAEASVASLMRKGHTTQDVILVVCNFTPMPRANYRVGGSTRGMVAGNS